MSATPLIIDFASATIDRAAKGLTLEATVGKLETLASAFGEYAFSKTIPQPDSDAPVETSAKPSSWAEVWRLLDEAGASEWILGPEDCDMSPLPDRVKFDDWPDESGVMTAKGATAKFASGDKARCSSRLRCGG